MEAAPGLAHEAVVSNVILHILQSLEGGIGLEQGIPNPLKILGGDQGFSSAEHTGEQHLDIGQHDGGGLTTARQHSAHTCAIKFKIMLKPGQPGRQKVGIPTEAVAHRMDGGLRVVDL